MPSLCERAAITSALSSHFALGLSVDGFIPAFWGALVITVVSFVLSIFVREPKKHEHD